jgi:hypothetical protein
MSSELDGRRMAPSRWRPIGLLLALGALGVLARRSGEDPGREIPVREPPAPAEVPERPP